MKLRARLFVTSLAVAIPLAFAVFLLNERMRLADMEQAVRRYIASSSLQDALARCDTPTNPAGPRGMRGGGRRGDPPSPHGPRPEAPSPPAGPYELFSYASDFRPMDPRSPAMPAALQQALSRRETRSTTFLTGEGVGIAVGGVIGGADSRCPYVLARMRPRMGALHDQLMAIALVFVSVLGAAWTAAGPVIARMRRLGASVRRSAESEYEEAVSFDGSDELADLAHAFNDAGASIRRHVSEVQARESSLRRFVANTTHDVALPLTVLWGHLIDLERETLPGSDTHRHIAEAMQEAHYMGSLIRNLGAAARLEEIAAVERHPVDLSALVERVVSRHLANARARQVTIHHAVPEGPIAAMADLTLLEQSVSNLADNAVQYNRPGGRVAIVLDRQDQQRFSIAVKDDGPGVPPAELSALLGRRVRGSDARTRRPDGQGLGLAIAAEACERLGFALVLTCPDEGGLMAVMSGPLVN